MDENSTEIKIDHHNGPDPEVEKHLEEESMAALPQKESEPDELKPDEEIVISTKKTNLEVEATEPAEVAKEPETEAKPATEPVKPAEDSTKKTNTLTVAIIVVLFMIALAVVVAVLAARYFGK